MTASRNRFVPDALLFLEPQGSAAQTASGPSANSLYFPHTPNAEYWPAPTNTMNREFGVVVDVSAFAGAGNVTFALEADVTAAFAAPAIVASVTVPAADNVVTLAVVKDTIESLVPAATNFRLITTLGAGVSSLTYSAYLTDLQSI